MTSKIAKTLVVSAIVVCSTAFAQTKAPEPDYTVSYNVGLFSEYRYRGISQSGRKPALQGGADVAFKNGAYIGTWLSTISWIKDTGPGLKGPVEVDIYGGYKGAVNDTFSFDVGGLQYWYVNNNYKNIAVNASANSNTVALYGANANTFELYGALSAGPATLKYSRSLTELFGATNSKGSGYLELGATFDLGSGFSVVPHLGYQSIANQAVYKNYTDYSVALNKDFDGLVLSATLLGTNWKSKYGAPYLLSGSGSRDLAGNRLVLGIKKNF